MTEILDRKIQLLENAIKKCETAAYRSRGFAADLRHNGFDGDILGKLIAECQEALEHAYSYQCYANILDE